MVFSYRLRRRVATSIALPLFLGLGGCGPHFPSKPKREGPPVTWSLPADVAQQHRVARVGDVLVVPEERVVRGIGRSTGKEVWRHQMATEYRLAVASGLLVTTQSAGDKTGTLDGPLEVLDAATGTVRWQSPGGRSAVYQNAVYVWGCKNPNGAHPTGCTITARDVRDGRTLWTAPNAGGAVTETAIGAREPYAPTAGRYVAASIGSDARPWAALDTATGRALRGRAPDVGWDLYLAGDFLVVSDNDPPAGEDACVVTVTAVNAATGAESRRDGVFSGRQHDGSCERRLVSAQTGLTVIGAGSRIAAVSGQETPEVFDLATGRAIWVGDAAGVPIDGDGRSLLVRTTVDSGELTLLDFATGRQRWKAPDTGLSGQSASWGSIVTSRLVGVMGADQDDHPFALVYDADSGRRLGRFPGWLVGAGDDWVAVIHTPESGKLTLDFIRF